MNNCYINEIEEEKILGFSISDINDKIYDIKYFRRNPIFRYNLVGQIVVKFWAK